MRYNIAHLIWFQIKVFPPSNNMQLGPINYNILSPIVSFSFLSISTISVLKKRQAGQSQCNLLYSSTTGVINLETTKSRHTFTFQLKSFTKLALVANFLGWQYPTLVAVTCTKSDCKTIIRTDTNINTKTNTTLYELVGGSRCTGTKNRN